ncbi:hypothetical protein HK101_006700 [Irineochytrium annulatum]|nr:hypothetical protein HK101_006700 [Irineochytrium annulatum]
MSSVSHLSSSNCRFKYLCYKCHDEGRGSATSICAHRQNKTQCRACHPDRVRRAKDSKLARSQPRQQQESKSIDSNQPLQPSPLSSFSSCDTREDDHTRLPALPQPQHLHQRLPPISSLIMNLEREAMASPPLTPVVGTLVAKLESPPTLPGLAMEFLPAAAAVGWEKEVVVTAAHKRDVERMSLGRFI